LITVLCDSSIVIKWCHDEGEAEVAESRALLNAHRRGDIDAMVLDLATYEVGNVLVRALGWSAEDTADQLDDLLVLCGGPIALGPEWRRDAAALAVGARLTFYDGAWAAAARGLGVTLVSADARLQAAGYAKSPTEVVRNFALPLTP
jgi:predicted nucleic acid-binding protein